MVKNEAGEVVSNHTYMILQAFQEEREQENATVAFTFLQDYSVYYRENTLEESRTGSGKTILVDTPSVEL